MHESIKVLDHGYVRFIEAWGHGDAGHGFGADKFGPTVTKEDFECGIVEAARQSTQGSFRGWEDYTCLTCHGTKEVEDYSKFPPGTSVDCPDCQYATGQKDEYGCSILAPTGINRGDARLLASLYNSKPQHATPFEFAGMTIEVQAPILVYREWHRHRTQSYNEMSARYAPLPNNNYVPDWENLKERGERGEKSRNKQEKGTHPWNENGARGWWLRLPEVYDQLERMYQEALGVGVPKEMARILIPVGRYSRMRATGNLRNWLAFITLRSDPAAQWEIRQFSLVVEQIVKKKFPRTWDLFLKRRDSSGTLPK